MKLIANKIEGFLTTKEQVCLMHLAQGKKCVVEIGAFKGKSTVCLASTGIHVYSIDPHISPLEHHGVSSYPDFEKNVRGSGLWDKVTPIVAKSEDAVKTWANGKTIDFLWIDGDHHYEEAMKDFNLWMPFVREGGIIAFHDSTCLDVQKVVLEVKDYVNYIGLWNSISVFKNEPPGFGSFYYSTLNRLVSFARNLVLPTPVRAVLKSLRP